MKNKIKVSIYGNKLSILGADSSCGHGAEDDCGGCSSKKSEEPCFSCHKVASKENKSTGDLFYSLVDFIELSDVKEKVDLEFIELDKNKIGGSAEIEEILERGFEAPIVVIDGIVRYYGGISNLLIYEDVKELLQ